MMFAPKPPCLLGLAIALCSLGCGDLDSEPPQERDLTSNSQDPDSSPPDSGALAGVWAQKITVSSLSNVPFVGEVTTTTTSLLRLHIAQADDELLIVSETCSVSMESSSTMVRTIIPQAFVRALEIDERSGRIIERDGLLDIEFDRSTEVRGARLEDRENEPLPESDDDPRVFDQDGDGNPGMTVRVEGLISGEIYLVQRGWNVLRGSMVSDRAFNGLVQWGDEQVILGANNSLLLQGPESRPDPNQQNSYFYTRRISESQDCAAIVAAAGSLF